MPSRTLRIFRAVSTFVVCANSLVIGLAIWSYAPPDDPSIHIMGDIMFITAALTFAAYVLECVELKL